MEDRYCVISGHGGYTTFLKSKAQSETPDWLNQEQTSLTKSNFLSSNLKSEKSVITSTSRTPFTKCIACYIKDKKYTELI